MAIEYWALAGNDTTGDGTAGNPYQTLGKAVTQATANGEARNIGVIRRVLANPATWTNGSATVTVSGDETAQIAASDFLRVDADGSGRTTCWYKVTSASFAGGVTTITLTRTYRGQTVSSATWSVTPENWSALAPNYTGANNVLCTFGWNAAGAQPANVMSAISMADGAGTAMTQTTNYGCCAADGRLLLCRANIGLNGRWRVRGALDVSECAYGLYSVAAGDAVDVDALVSSYNTTRGISTTRGVIRSAVLHNQLWAFQGGGSDFALRRLYVHTASGYVLANAWGRFGDIETANCGAGNVLHTNADSELIPFCWIDRWTTDAAVAIMNTVAILSPNTSFQWNTVTGKVDLTTGRAGGGDLCLRLDPVGLFGKQIPITYPVRRWVKAGSTLTLTFWAKYSGTQVPECFVGLMFPNGLTSQRVAFTPTTSWARYTVNLTGTTALDGDVGILFGLWDNVAADALLFVDDVAITGAGRIPLSGDGMWHGITGDFLVDRTRDLPAWRWM